MDIGLMIFSALGVWGFYSWKKSHNRDDFWLMWINIAFAIIHLLSGYIRPFLSLEMRIFVDLIFIIIDIGLILYAVLILWKGFFTKKINRNKVL